MDGSPELGIGLMAPTLFAAEPFDLDGLEAAAAIADSGTYESLWVGDHLLWHVPLLEAFVTLGALATQTQRVRIGTNVLQLAMRQPLVVAKALATLDYLTGGRVTLGVGVGGEFETEWEAAGVSPRQRGARTDEALKMLRAFWAGEAHSGEFYESPGVPLEPTPRAPLPVWVGGRSDAALRRASEWDGYIGYMLSPRRYGDVRDELIGLGVDPGTYRFGLQIMTRIDSSKEAATATAVTAMSRTYGIDASPMSRYLAVGSPEDIAGFVNEFVDRGLDHASFYLQGPGWIEQAHQLTEEVLPLLGSPQLPG